MEQVYALGITVIECIQQWFADSEGYFEFVNNVSNPSKMLEVVFPLLSIVDSVFAAQLCLCIAFGGWLNAVMKWWLLEDRPYWWLQVTDFYASSPPPVLRQFKHTCETGPGSPSGHSQTTAMMLLLAVCWISHICNDRKWNIWWWKLVVYPVFGAMLVSVMLARMFVATHFPHQVIMGAIIGAFLAPALCIYVSDPYIWQYGYHARLDVATSMMWHVLSAAVTVAISMLTYVSLIVCGWEPHWTVKLAFRWCESPENIHVATTPMYALVHSCGHLLGWAFCVTPAVANYRHYTKDRSLILATFSMSFLVYSWKLLQENISKDSAWRFYAIHFVLCVIKPALLLRVAPLAAMWPYRGRIKEKTN